MIEEHPSLAVIDTYRTETEAVAKELLDKCRDVVESRRKLKEAEASVATLTQTISDLTAKIEELAQLKNANAILEKEVLEKIRAKL